MSVSGPLFTVLLAVLRPPVCLPFAIQSVLAQTVDSFELFVICDGAPAETVACAEEFARCDPRVRVFALPKGDRNGEAHWHNALQDARGRYVAHIEDDDLWFPNHLEEMAKLLDTVDFGHLIHSYVRPSDSQIMVFWADIGSASYRQKFLDAMYNRIGFTFVGYRLDAYRRLPEGWAPSPPGFWPDLWMWRKFFRMPDFRFGTRAAITAIAITAHLRDYDITDNRSAESHAWLERINDPLQRAEIVEAAWRSLINECIELSNWALDLDTALAEARKHYRELDETYHNLEQSFHNLEKYRSDLEKSFHNVEQYSRDLEQHIHDLEKGRVELKRRSREIEQRNSELEERTRVLDEHNYRLEERLRQLDRRNHHMAIELIRAGFSLPWSVDDSQLIEVSREALADLLTSTSWRSTRLLRRAVRLCTGRGGNDLTADTMPSSFLERQRLIREIPKSTSWRITSPVRVIGGLLQRFPCKGGR